MFILSAIHQRQVKKILFFFYTSAINFRYIYPKIILSEINFLRKILFTSPAWRDRVKLQHRLAYLYLDIKSIVLN